MKVTVGYSDDPSELQEVELPFRNTRPELLIVDDEGPPADLEAMRRWVEAQPWVAEAIEQRRRFEERHPMRPGSILDALRGGG